MYLHLITTLSNRLTHHSAAIIIHPSHQLPAPDSLIIPCTQLNLLSPTSSTPPQSPISHNPSHTSSDPVTPLLSCCLLSWPLRTQRSAYITSAQIHHLRITPHLRSQAASTHHLSVLPGSLIHQALVSNSQQRHTQATFNCHSCILQSSCHHSNPSTTPMHHRGTATPHPLAALIRSKQLYTAAPRIPCLKHWFVAAFILLLPLHCTPQRPSSHIFRIQQLHK